MFLYGLYPFYEKEGISLNFFPKRYAGEAERAFFEGDFPTTVRRSQEALELAVKAELRYIAIEYPKEHDVGDVVSRFISPQGKNTRLCR